MARKISAIIISAVFALGAPPIDGALGETDAPFNKEAFIQSAKIDAVLQIGLVDCIAYVLKNNSEIKIKRIEPLLREDDIRIAGGEFEPVLYGGATYSKSKESTASTLFSRNAVSVSNDLSAEAGLKGKIVTGAEYDLNVSALREKTNSAFQSINPSYTLKPKVTITQPLFRRCGMLVNKADITIARNNKTISEADFKSAVMGIVTDAKTAYYNCIYTRESYSLSESSLKRAKDLLDINRLRYEKGLASSVDLLETETVVAEREKTLLAAEANKKKADDVIKVITNLVDDPHFWNAELEYIDEPEFNVVETDLAKSLQNAFILRPDYQGALLDLKNRDIKIKVAKNALFSSVDLVGSFGLNGLGEDYKKAIKNFDEENKDWSVGLTVSVPLGGSDRALYDQRQLEKAQALIALKRLEQNIIKEIRDKTRDVEIQKRQVEVAKTSKEKEYANYEAQKERYAAGQVSTHDMLEYQDSLAQSEIDYVKSLIEYNISIFNLEKAEGSALARNNINIEEENKKDAKYAKDDRKND